MTAYSDSIIERFENGTSDDVVWNIVTTIAMMIIGMIAAIFLWWGYQKGKYVFILILSAIFFAYAIKNMIIFIILRNQVDTIVFRMYFGSSLFAAFLTFVIMLVFGYLNYDSIVSRSSSASSAMEVMRPDM